MTATAPHPLDYVIEALVAARDATRQAATATSKTPEFLCGTLDTAAGHLARALRLLATVEHPGIPEIRRVGEEQLSQLRAELAEVKAELV